MDTSSDRISTAARPAGLLRLCGEFPSPARGCPIVGCDPVRVGPVDLYCADHERLIPFSAARFGKARWFVVNLVRVAVCGVFVLAAWLEISLPLFVLLAAAGLAVAVLPLYRFPFTSKVVAAAWLLACVAVQTLPLLPELFQRIAHTVLVGSVLVLALVHTGQLAWSECRRAVRPAAPAVVYSAFAAVPVFLAGWALTDPGVDIAFLPAPARTWLLLGAATGAIGAALIAAIAGAVDGQSAVNRNVSPVLRARETAWAVRWQAEVRTATGAKGIERAVTEFSGRTVASAVAAARGVANLLLRAAHLLQVLGVRVIVKGHRYAVIGRRRTVAAGIATGSLMVESVELARSIGPRTGRAVVLPALCVAVAAMAAASGSEVALRYLLTDHLFSLADLGATFAVGVGTLTFVWMSLSGLSFPSLAKSWLHSASIALPYVVVVCTLGGWAVGLPGTLGYGPVTLGPLTLVTTALLVSTFAWTRWSPKARSRTPHPAPRTAGRETVIDEGR